MVDLVWRSLLLFDDSKALWGEELELGSVGVRLRRWVGRLALPDHHTFSHTYTLQPV